MSKKAQGAWTEEEHVLFETGLELYGAGNWKEIASLIPTRNHLQVRTHALRHFEKLRKGGKQPPKPGRKARAPARRRPVPKRRREEQEELSDDSDYTVGAIAIAHEHSGSEDLEEEEDTIASRTASRRGQRLQPTYTIDQDDDASDDFDSDSASDYDYAHLISERRGAYRGASSSTSASSRSRKRRRSAEHHMTSVEAFSLLPKKKWKAYVILGGKGIEVFGTVFEVVRHESVHTLEHDDDDTDPTLHKDVEDDDSAGDISSEEDGLIFSRQICGFEQGSKPVSKRRMERMSDETKAVIRALRTIPEERGTFTEISHEIERQRPLGDSTSDAVHDILYRTVCRPGVVFRLDRRVQSMRLASGVFQLMDADVPHELSMSGA